MSNFLPIKNVNLYFDCARPADIDAIMQIENACFAPHIRETKETFLERINVFTDGFYLLRQAQDNKVVGYICTEIWEREVDNLCKTCAKVNAHKVDSTWARDDFVLGHSISTKHSNNGSNLYISSIALLPTLRGLGAGRAFFSAVIAQIAKNYPNIKNFVLLVCEEWMAARSIYQKEGFVQVAEFKDFFAVEEARLCSGLVMTKSGVDL